MRANEGAPYQSKLDALWRDWRRREYAVGLFGVITMHRLRRGNDVAGEGDRGEYRYTVDVRKRELED